MKFGFLFGAGAEVGYGLPSAGKFALDIFRHDTSESKQSFKKKINSVDPYSGYANKWLPEEFKRKNISTFGKSVYQNIIKDTVGHNRNLIIKKINSFDEIAEAEATKLKPDINIGDILKEAIDRDLNDTHLSQNVSFIPEFSDGNKLFESSYFSALLLVYKQNDTVSGDERRELGKILTSIMQLHVGALGEALTRRVNDAIFNRKDDDIDIFDDLGDIFQVNYASSGQSGLEYLLEQCPVKPEPLGKNAAPSKLILRFAQNILEAIFVAVLNYKTLIDSNWMYLYSPKTDWAKFCKVCIFLLTVQDYMLKEANNANLSSKNGYYNWVRNALDEQLFDISAVATTNYNKFIQEILNLDVAFLNGSTSMWYDPYINRVVDRGEQEDNHILVPLMFTQSGTKPMTSIDISSMYVETYSAWKESDAIVVVGFGFGSDDEHINGVIRTLIDVDNKKVIIVMLDDRQPDHKLRKEYAEKLKISNDENLSFIRVNKQGDVMEDGGFSNTTWVQYLPSFAETACK